MEITKNNRNAILGLTILSLGTLLLMDNFNIIDFPIRHYLLSWKTFLIALGLFLIVGKQKLGGGIFLMGLGFTFWLPAMLGYQVTLNQVFIPSMLILSGIVVLINTVFKNKLQRNRHSDDDQSGSETIEVEIVE